MAEIKIASTPESASMTAQYIYEGRDTSIASHWTTSVSRQIVSYDLGLLGSAPEITDIAFEVDSSHRSNDKIAVKIGTTVLNLTPQNPTAGLIPATKSLLIASLQSAVSNATPLSATITFNGTQPSGTRSVTQTSTVAVRLVVTITGEGGGGDNRSQGELSASSVAFGESIGMTITPRSPEFSHQVTYRLGSHVWTDTVAAGSVMDSFILPMGWLDALPRAVTGTMEITLTTIGASGPVGTQAYTVRVTVPDSVVPTAGTLTAEAANSGALAGDARFFAGASRAALTLTGAAAGQGSSIASITYSGWGDSVTTPNLQYLTDSIQVSGTVTIQALVTDGRGRTAETSVTVLVYDYEQPFFVSIDVTRCDTSGVPDDEGSAVIINAVFGCSTTAIQDNTATATVAFLASGSSTWSREFALTNNEDVLITAYPLSASVSYQMRFTVTDHAMSVVLYMSVPSAKYILHFSNNGASIGVGQAAESLGSGEMGRFTVNPDWTVKLGTNILIGQQTLAEYIQSIVSSM